MARLRTLDGDVFAEMDGTIHMPTGAHEVVEQGGLDWSDCLARSIMDSQDEEDPED